jgi:hypothetical protein
LGDNCGGWELRIPARMHIDAGDGSFALDFPGYLIGQRSVRSNPPAPVYSFQAVLEPSQTDNPLQSQPGASVTPGYKVLASAAFFPSPTSAKGSIGGYDDQQGAYRPSMTFCTPAGCLP